VTMPKARRKGFCRSAHCPARRKHRAIGKGAAWVGFGRVLSLIIEVVALRRCQTAIEATLRTANAMLAITCARRTRDTASTLAAPRTTRHARRESTTRHGSEDGCMTGFSQGCGRTA
jgi:hypothetical protein